MSKIRWNKKFLIMAGVCLTVAGAVAGFAVKHRASTKASDGSIQIHGMSVTIRQCEGRSQEIMEEDIDETISEEVMSLEEKGQFYEIGDFIETDHISFVPMVKEADSEEAYNAFGGITSKSGKNYIIVVKSEKELTKENLTLVADAVRDQVK